MNSFDVELQALIAKWKDNGTPVSDLIATMEAELAALEDEEE